jgi:ribonuclease D
MGRDIMAAVRSGRKQDHGPIPKLANGRRRMDRQAERRLTALKTWRAGRAEDLSMDPGVLCPNSALEAIAWRAPQAAKDLRELRELKGWFQREFGAEVTQVSREVEATARSAAKAVSKAASRPAAKAKP